MPRTIRWRTAMALMLSIAMLAPVTALSQRVADAVEAPANVYVAGSVGAGGVPTPSGALNAGDCAMVIQMTGSFATGLGTFEVLDPATATPARTYGVGEVVQYVVLPGGCDQPIEVSSTYSPPPWNGSTGGVVFLGGTDLTMTARIDATGTGFRSVDKGLTGADCDGGDGIPYKVIGNNITMTPGGAGGGGVIGGGGGAAGHAGWFSSGADAFGNSPGLGGTATAPGAGGESDIDGGQNDNDGTNTVFEADGGNADCVGMGGDSPGERPPGGGPNSTVGGGGGGGGSYGAGGAGCSAARSGAYSSGGGGGGSWTGGGTGGLGGDNRAGATGDTPNEDGGSGNAAEAAVIANSSHYLNEDDPRLVMGGAGGDSFTAINSGPDAGGNGGGIIYLAFNSVDGGSNQISSNGLPGTTPDNGGHGSSGSGGGAGGQIAIEAPSVSDLRVNANGAQGGPAVSSEAGGIGGRHTGSAGAPGGGGGVWFRGAAPTPVTNTGPDNGTISTTSSFAPPGLTNVDWAVLGGTAASVESDTITIGATVYTYLEWGRFVNTAGPRSLATGSPMLTEMAIETGQSEADLAAAFPDLAKPDNPKNLAFGCQPGNGGGGLVSATAPATYDLALVKVLTGTAPDEVGEVATYTVVVRNQGAVAGSFEVTDTLPAGLVYVAGSATNTADAVTGVDIAVDETGTTADPAAPGSLVWTIGATDALEPDEEVSLTFQATLQDVTLGTYRNDAEISSDNGNDIDSFPDTDVANDSDNDSDTTNDVDDTRDYTDVADVANTDVNADDEDDHDPAVFTVDRPLRIGNLVWLDANNNGLVDDGETPLAGVTVQLWTDSGGDGVFTPGVDDAGVPVTATTDAAGNYWFEDLDPNETYFVAIADGQAPITGYVSSTGAGEDTAENDTDNIDDGDGAIAGYTSVSGPIGLAIDGEPSLEGDENTDAGGDGSAETYVSDPTRSGPWFDTDSNLTIDLGLYQPYDLALAKTITTVSSPLVPNGTVEFALAITNQGAPVQTVDVTDNIDTAQFQVFADAANPAGTAGGFDYTWAGDGTAAPTLTLVAPDAATVFDTDATITVPLTLTIAAAWDGSPLENWAEISRFDNNLDAADGDSAQPGTGTQLVDIDSTPDTIDGSDGSQGPGEDPAQDHVDDEIDEDGTAGGDEDDHDVARYTPEYDLALAKVIESVNATGDEVTYEIVVRNQGEVFAGAFDVTDEIPAGMAFVSASDGGTDSGTTVSWPIPATPALAPDSSITLTLVLEIVDPAQAPFVNTAEISDDSGDDDDSTPDTTLSGAGADNLVDITDVTDLETDTDSDDPDEDDHDIAVVDVPLYRLGNLVWFDANDNGVADDGEEGIGNVEVQLFEAGGTTPIATTTTDGDGKYSFADLAAGDYFVLIPSGQTGQTIGAETINLDDYFGSTPVVADPDAAGDEDNDNNGNPIATGHESGIVSIGDPSQFSPQEPTDEVLRDGSATDDDDDAFPDNQSNYAVDFGFVEPLRVGNTVWLDNGGGFGSAGYIGADDDDGQADPGETGIAGVLVQLIDDTGAVVAATNTDADGYYLFDGLRPGNYQVGIPEDQAGADEPTALDGLNSSTGASADPEAADDDDDGDPDTGFASISQPFELAYGDEAQDELGDFNDPTAGGAEAGANGKDGFAFDGSSNLEVDFGFVETPLYRIGNLIWEDYNNNGVAEDGEPGIQGILVQLLDNTGAVVAETVTDGDGHYVFEGREAGEYRVNVPADQTPDLVDPQPDIVPGVLDGLDLSGTPVTDPDAPGDVDNDQNGVDESGDITSGVLEVGETSNSEPTGETERDDLTALDEDPAARDDRSNLTVDIGLFRGLRLGNQVWLDGMVGEPGYNNGVFEVGEVGIGGVDVELWIDSDSSGDFDPTLDTLVDTSTTDAEGNYLFEGLEPGVPYIVAIEEVPSDAPGDLSSFDFPGGQSADPVAADNDDDGAPEAGYVSVSQPVTLTAGATTTGEADTAPAEDAEAEANANGGSEYPDANSELSVDFGFIEVPLYRVGNLVWNDANNDGVATIDEGGIAGVLVQLVNADGDVIAETVTDADGKYLFENLVAGDYSVRIPSDQTPEGADPGIVPGALDGFLSSSNGEEADPNEDADNNDNGLGTTDWESAPVTLGETLTGDEPDNETNRDDDPTDDDPNAGEPGFYPDNLSNVTVDFGFYQLSLGNQVWLDLDNNGVLDPTEDGIEGVAVELYDVTGGAPVLVDSTTTGPDGEYLFTGLTDGNEYFVRIPATEFEAGAPLEDLLSSSDPDAGANPVGDSTGTDNDDNGVDPTNRGDAVDSLPVVLDAGDEPETEPGLDNDPDTPDASENLTADFGFHPGLRIGSLVWIDDGNGTVDDENGIADPSEAGVDGVDVELYLDDGTTPGEVDAGDTFIGTETTADGGIYEFGGLDEGDYLVVIPQTQFDDGGALNGYTATDTTTATDVNNDNDGTQVPTVGMVSSVVQLSYGDEPTDEANNGTDGTVDEDDLYADANSNLSIDFGVIETPLYRIGNLVWNDANHNGVADSDELGIVDVVVELLDENGTVIAVQVTDVDGTYAFDNLPAGDYQVRIPTGGIPDTYVSSTNGEEADANDDIDNNENGVETTGGWISSVVTLGNDDGEPVDEVVRANGPVVDDDDSGPAGTPDDRSNYSVDFGFYELSLGNQVFLDWDNSGELDGPDEVGVEGVAVTLLDAADGSVLDTTTTDADGLYLFTGLNEDTEYIVQIDASNFEAGAPLDGFHSSDGPLVGGDPDDDATDSDDNGAPQDGAVLSDPIMLVADEEPTSESPDNDPTTPDGNENLTVDFGFYSLTVGNQVWFDSNNDGAIDPGEAPIEGVAVTLIDPADGSVLDTTTTDADGLYLFTGLAEGDYVVQIDDENFEPGGPLEGLRSSPPESDPDDVTDDDDDNGTNDGTVQSPTFTLSAGDAPAATGDTSNADPDVPLTNQNLNVDFGFHGMSLGNLVWLDMNGNGIVDPEESGRVGVTVELWESDDDGNLIGDAPLATQVTDDEGHYLFTGLEPGTYSVVVPGESFDEGGPLFGYGSTIGNGVDAPDPDDGDLDSDDNGDPLPSGDVVTKPVTLEAGAEPTDETDISTNPSLVNNADDANSNLTVDLGFTPRPGLSLGNQLWHDLDGNGLIDPDEPGIDGVRVELYDEDGNLVAFDVSENGGFYLFPGLEEGDYTVVIPASNFDEPTDPLWGYFAPDGTPTDPDDDVDLDNDGIAPSTPFGDVTSQPVTLVDLFEPVGETAIEAPGDHIPDDPNDNLTVDFAFVQVALGGTLFDDPGEDGTQQSGDDVFSGVIVTLLDADGQPVLDGAGNPISTTTDDNGEYLFTGLKPGDYIVEVPASQFEPGGPLAGQGSSRGTSDPTTGLGPDPDNDEDLIDDGDPVSGDVFVPGPVRTQPVTIDVGTEPDDEVEVLTSGLPNSNENLTVDLGFFEIPLVELGGIIWIDDNNDGTVDEDEVVAPEGAQLNLLDENGEPVRDADGNPVTTTTRDDGSYIFEGLQPGTYIVEIDESNVAPGAPLENLRPSTGPGVSPDPNDDAVNVSDGYGEPNGGVRSRPVTVSVEQEPVDAADPDPVSSPDSSSNLTVDFGLYQVEVAGFVWIDVDNDGVVDPNETPVEGVKVSLVNEDGTPALDPSGNPLVATTNADGKYEFVGVAEGTYRVSLDSENFEPGGPLSGLQASVAADNAVQSDGSFWSVPFTVEAGTNAPGSSVVAVELGLRRPPAPVPTTPFSPGPATASSSPAPAPNPAPSPKPSTLALTGTNSRLMALLSALLIIGGSSIVVGSHRVRRRHYRA